MVGVYHLFFTWVFGFFTFLVKINNFAIIILCMKLYSDYFLKMNFLGVELLVGHGRELTHFINQVTTNISTPSKACFKRGRLT